jgi:hypothetical protein
MTRQAAGRQNVESELENKDCGTKSRVGKSEQWAAPPAVQPTAEAALDAAMMTDSSGRPGLLLRVYGE